MVLAAGLLAITGCNKATEERMVRSGSREVVLSPQVREAGRHSHNPYDYIGEMHNRLLGSLIEEEKKNGLMDDAQKKAYITRFVKEEHGLDMSASMHKKRPLEQGIYSELVAQSNWSQVGKDLLLSFHEIIERIGVEDSFEAEVAEFEQMVLDNPELPEAERVGLLQTTAIGKYSCRFWKDHYFNNEAGLARWLKDVIKVITGTHMDIAGGVYSILMGESIMDIYLEAAYQSALWPWYIEAVL